MLVFVLHNRPVCIQWAQGHQIYLVWIDLHLYFPYYLIYSKTFPKSIILMYFLFIFFFLDCDLSQEFHTHPIDRIARKHHVQQIIREPLARLPYHYQVKIERKFKIIESMTIVAAIVWALYHAILNSIAKRRYNKNQHNRSISNHNIIQPHQKPVRKLPSNCTPANAILTVTHQRALPTASFPMICKIGCRPSKSFEVQPKRPFHHRHVLHRLHDWGRPNAF